MKKIILLMLFFCSFLITSCISARDIYDYNYDGDQRMMDEMMKNYGDPFYKKDQLIKQKEIFIVL